MSYRNWFSLCFVDDHSSGREIFSCMNIMGESFKHFVYNSKIAMCEYHTCLVIQNRDDDSHNELVCSGAILRFGDDKYYFNPLTPFGIDFDKMLQLPESTVDYFSRNVQYYFQNDVRSTFSSDIVDINCTNDMRTCITFNDSSVCFGNKDDIGIIHSSASLVNGVIVAFTLGSIAYLFLKKEVSEYPLSFVFLFYIVPLVGIGMMYNGWFLSMSIPYLLGNIIVIVSFQLIYYPLRDFNNYLYEKKTILNRHNKY
jgi:hypothetical protein